MTKMIHMDWTAWDAWMEMNDSLVQRGVIPTCEEVTRRSDMLGSVETPDRELNLLAMRKFNRDLANLEESRIRAGMRW